MALKTLWLAPFSWGPYSTCGARLSGEVPVSLTSAQCLLPIDIPPPHTHIQLTSKDGAVLSVGADVQFRIWDPVLSVMTVKDLNTATRMTAQNAMTKALLKRPLREIQMEKLKISDQLLVGSSWP